jgi:uncharacterized protein (DUF983 family)
VVRAIEVLWDTGFRLFCPVCEQGKVFETWFKMNATCPHCHVRFERNQGEATGGMTLSIVITSLIFLTGYMTTEYLYDWPLWVHFAIWLPFSVLFPILFYRYSRALWVAILHLHGDVYWDQEPYEEPTLSITDAFFNRTSTPPPSEEGDDAPPQPSEQP